MERARRTLELAAYAAALVLVTLYFFQSATLAPNHADGGLLLQYIDGMAHGQRPFYDFADAYGPLNWVFPVAFYRAFGDRVWGVRMWLVLMKVVTVVATFVLVRRLSQTPHAAKEEGPPFPEGTFYGAVGGFFTAILLGARWQSLETAYAFLTVMPLVLSTWYLVLCAPLSTPRKNVTLAALLTAATIWTKLNTGMYLFAAGLFAYFFLTPYPADPTREPGREVVTPRTFRRMRYAGGAAYVLMFSLMIRRYFDVWFFLYLFVPLLLGVAWTLRVMPSTSDDERPSRYLSPWLRYLTTTVIVSLMVLVGYYGSHSKEYLSELATILAVVKYTAPFAALLVPGHYVGLNEYGWLQLPLLATTLFVVWIGSSRRAGPHAFGAAWRQRRAQVGGLFVMVTLHTFGMYARCDETHIFQVLVLAVPAITVFVAHLEAFVTSRLPSRKPPFRLAVVGVGIFFAQSLFVVPTAAAFEIGKGDWSSPALEHLRYRGSNRYVKQDSPSLTDRAWDAAMDRTAQYIKSVSSPNDRMLMLTADRILYVATGTRPVGDRYHFFFYLASVGLIDREGFDRLVPEAVLQDILEHPPHVLVSAYGGAPLEVVFPELRDLRDHRYVLTRHYRHILVYELRTDGQLPPRQPAQGAKSVD